MQSALLRHTTVTAAAVLFAAAGTLLAAKPAQAQPFAVAIHASPAIVAAAPSIDHYAEWRAGWAPRADHRAPVVTEVTPSQGEGVSARGLTQVSAHFRDHGSGIQSVSLRVDGRDVTRQARIDRDDVRYRADLRPGRHFAELQLRDHAGNVTRRSWSFDVYGGWHHGPVGMR
ncbi:MAG TPA: Ig-like domain-containing protein [Ramlibacter sp.]|uniref:Ig-like domain-containing protein n=1 Tax=Ramlibacter sp. TaxID=1917967 RepID=UPI002CA0F10A|nr:Ig-like domain-containing protein [Ramlibacter sp.]HVZ46215.1 Ig-like domain-containing protein [Ramlibacter sp.]